MKTNRIVRALAVALFAAGTSIAVLGSVAQAAPVDGMTPGAAVGAEALPGVGAGAVVTPGFVSADPLGTGGDGTAAVLMEQMMQSQQPTDSSQSAGGLSSLSTLLGPR